MSKSFVEYLSTIGIVTPTAVTRTEEALNALQALATEEIEDIFVSEVVTQEGPRAYQGVFAFSKNYVREARAFLNSPDYEMDIMRLKDLAYVQVRLTAFDFTNASGQSRLLCIARHQSMSLTLNLQASGVNCESLWKIMSKYVLPHI